MKNPKMAQTADNHENYLGSPELVERLVRDYCAQVHDMMRERGQGTMSKEEFKVQLSAMINRNADIFTGRDPAYKKIVGWNSPYGMFIALRQVLGEFWTKYASEYDDNPAKALFGLLATSVVENGLKALNGDPDAAGKDMNHRILLACRVLTNTHRRA
ncbi:MAG: hypothetical protein VB032_06365 [Burkholderiaceae bacterium]|nr:hypothetical protein [Burkholderiaceae bacterium]